MPRLYCSVPFLLLAAMAASGQQQLEIVEASYGAGNFQMNVTQKLQALVRDNVLEISAEPDVLGGDPAPGTAKTLRIRYRYGGQTFETSAGDFAKVRIPSIIASVTVGAPAAAPATAPAPANNNGGRFSVGDLFGTRADAQPAGLRIVTARYGVDTRFNDVAQRLQGLVKDDRLSIKVDNAAMGGDPAVAKKKALEVAYEYRGSAYQARVGEGGSLNLPDANAKPIGPAAAAPTQAMATAAPATASAPSTPLGQAGGLRIFYARYGAGDRLSDVRERLRPSLQADKLSIAVASGALGGDPAPGAAKMLTVIYEWKGRTFEKSAADGQTLALP